MNTLAEVAHYVRSKNAGPFWITIDITCADRERYERCVRAESLQPEAVAAVYGVDPALVKRFELPDLCVLKISYPRPQPQGGAVERDMHGGQQYVRLLTSPV
ncbi:MAG: DUF4387 domain-containing protein [Acidimicrobiales bacterium]